MDTRSTKRRSDYTGIEKTCRYCKKQYEDVPERRLFYCSSTCWRLEKQVHCICKFCGKDYTTTKSRNTTFCNKKCESNYRIGKKRPEVGEAISKAKLKGREPAKSRQARKLKVYYDCRKVVFKRDNNTCQICGGIGTDIHHIVEMYKDKNKWFDPNNGITLCKSCHDTRVSKREEEWESYFNFNLMVRTF